VVGEDAVGFSLAFDPFALEYAGFTVLGTALEGWDLTCDPDEIEGGLIHCAGTSDSPLAAEVDATLVVVTFDVLPAADRTGFACKDVVAVDFQVADPTDDFEYLTGDLCTADVDRGDDDDDSGDDVGDDTGPDDDATDDDATDDDTADDDDADDDDAGGGRSSSDDGGSCCGG
jgi:hypothetical protein